MHVGLEATPLRISRLGGVWRYTESLIRALARRPGAHRYSLLFFSAFRRSARMPTPSITSSSMRFVDVTSTSNFLFTFFVPLLPWGAGAPSVESFLGPVDVFHTINAALLPQRQGRRVVT